MQMRSELRECLETGSGNFNVKHMGFVRENWKAEREVAGSRFSPV